jgi:transcriptional regulator with XRE-family HTH domain
LSRTSITNIEKGRQPVQVHLLLKLAEALGISAASLLPERRSVLEPVNSKALHGLEPRSREWVEKILRNDQSGKEAAG